MSRADGQTVLWPSPPAQLAGSDFGVFVSLDCGNLSTGGDPLECGPGSLLSEGAGIAGQQPPPMRNETPPQDEFFLTQLPDEWLWSTNPIEARNTLLTLYGSSEAVPELQAGWVEATVALGHWGIVQPSGAP